MEFKLGDAVSKDGGDYTFKGVVVGIVVKRSKAIRVVVEDDRGLLFIFNPDQIKLVGQVES